MCSLAFISSVTQHFTIIAHSRVHMMLRHGKNLDGGPAEELRLVEGTCNVYVTTGRTLDGGWYAHTVVQRCMLSSP